ncbi:RNA polymerase I-specific transcription initiation factor rrn3 [Linum grandiflorum]
MGACPSVPSADMEREEAYRKIMEVMIPPRRLDPRQVARILTSVKALSEPDADIDKPHHEEVVRSIFDMSLRKSGHVVVDAWFELIVTLAVSNGQFDHSCLDRLVKNFSPSNGELDKLTLEPSGLERKEIDLPRIHAALKDMSELVPLAASKMLPILWEHMLCNPELKLTQSKSRRLLIFVENMLKLERCAITEFVGSCILSNLMIMLRDLDVAIVWGDIGHDLFSKGISPPNEDDHKYRELFKSAQLDTSIAAEMLDSLLVQTFGHLESTLMDKRLSEVFDILLNSFKDTVLTTDVCKFSQFVMFYACALDPEHCGLKFANELMDVFVCDKNPRKRRSAALYLACFLARGKFLSPAFVASFVERLVDWCLQHCAMLSADMNSSLDDVFYFGFQAIMYVLCFHMRSIVGLKPELFPMLDRIFAHKLNPLKTKDVSPLGSHQLWLDQSGLDPSKDYGRFKQLDVYFPFAAPCRLKHSYRDFIEPNYVHWEFDLDEDEEDGSKNEAVEDSKAIYDSELLARNKEMAVSRLAELVAEICDSDSDSDSP